MRPFIALFAALLAFAVPARASASRDFDIEVLSSDKVKLRGVVVVPDPPGGAPDRRWPLAIVLHAMYRSRDSVLQVADALAERGVATALLDVRGHGQSQVRDPRGIYSFLVVPPSDIRKAADDQQRLLEELAKQRPEVDAARVAVLGIGKLALVAAEAGARIPQVKALVLVDPTDPSLGFKPNRDLGLFGARPVLLVATAFQPSLDLANLYAGYGAGERTVYQSDTFERMDRALPAGSPALAHVADWIAARLGVPAPAKP